MNDDLYMNLEFFILYWYNRSKDGFPLEIHEKIYADEESANIEKKDIEKKFDVVFINKENRRVMFI